MPESHAEQIGRIELMVSEPDSGTWDLSPNDIAALKSILDDRVALLDALKLYVDHFGDPLKVARAAIAKAEG